MILGGTYSTDAIMSTPLLGATAANCKLQFYYHHTYPTQAMGPTDDPFLTIKVNYPKNNIQKTITEFRKRVNAWTQATVHIGSMPTNFQVLMVAKGRVSAQTQPFVDIEIDNIQFSNCENTDVNWNTDLNCNFEAGTCGWNDVDLLTNSKLDWVRIDHFL